MSIFKDCITGEKRSLYSDTNGCIGNIDAYFSNDFFFCYKIKKLIDDSALHKETYLFMDFLREKYATFYKIRQDCKSTNRLFNKGAIPEYGLVFKSDFYSYYVRLNPIRGTQNFKIFIYKEDKSYDIKDT